MTYTKTNWVDNVTPLSAQNLNNLEKQYDAVKDELADNTGELWAQIKAADGAGSGLDADLLDGKDSAAFMNNNKVYGNVTYTDSIAAGSTLTKNIALGSSYKHGKAVVLSSGNIKSGLMAFFSTDSSKTMVVGNGNGTAVQNYGIAWTRRVIGRVANKYDTDSYTTFGTNVAGHPDLGIDEMYISGTNLVIIFHNHGPDSRSLNCTVDWEVW